LRSRRGCRLTGARSGEQSGEKNDASRHGRGEIGWIESQCSSARVGSDMTIDWAVGARLAPADAAERRFCAPVPGGGCHNGAAYCVPCSNRNGGYR
jgi:hypothetical protein